MTMDAALAGVPVEPFTGPDSYYTIGITETVPDVTGDSPSDAEAALQQAGFNPVLAGTVDSTEPAGTVARTSPAAGSQASQGSTVRIFVSNGKAPQPKHSKPPPSTKPSVPVTTVSPTPPVTTVSPSPPTATPPGHGHGHGPHARRR
jgi:beta-lactam-binding protein with PASTA domain